MKRRKPITLPVAAINLRLKQMRRLGISRAKFNQPIDPEAWAEIYAEGLARRYGGRALQSILIKDAKASRILLTDEIIEQAVIMAEAAFRAANGSAYSATMIGKALGVTLKERLEFARHLGCAEETNSERVARMKAEKAALNANRNRKSGKVSREKIKPWIAKGISRKTWYRMRKAQKASAQNTAKRRLALQPSKLTVH
jgi:hypothetical protein